MFLYFCIKIAGTNIDSWACSVLFLLCCCFCLCYVNIIATPDLIFFTFCYLNNFCSNNYSVKFDISVFLTKNAGVTIWCLNEFWGGHGVCLLVIKLSAYIMRGLVHVLCACYSSFIFLGHACPTWCSGKFPGHPEPQIMHVHVPPRRTYLIPSILWTNIPIRMHTYPYIITCTLNKKNKFHICEITHISLILKNIDVNMYM